MHTDGDKIYAGLQRTIDQIFATVKTGWPNPQTTIDQVAIELSQNLPGHHLVSGF